MMELVAESEREKNSTEMIRRAQRLEPDSLDAIVEEYAPRLYGYFHRVTGSRNDAEDLVQEVFVRVVRMLPHYRHDGRFDAWIFRIAANLHRDRLRRLKRSPVQGYFEPDQATETESGPRAGRTAEDGGLAPSARMEREEETRRLEAALARLPIAEREAVMLRHYGELSFEEIAELMQTPLGTALARAHRGLQKLREWMTTS